MTNREESLEEKFVEGLRRGYDIWDTFIYYNLFSIFQLTNSGFLEEIVDLYKKYPDDWFRQFHKFFRQIDYFDETNVGIIEPIISAEERKEQSEIKRYRSEVRKQHRDLSLEDGQKYSEYEKKLNERVPDYLEKGKRLAHLNWRANIYQYKQSISGHLDSIMWQTISSDKQNNLYNYMDLFFKKNLKKD